MLGWSAPSGEICMQKKKRREGRVEDLRKVQYYKTKELCLYVYLYVLLSLCVLVLMCA